MSSGDRHQELISAENLRRAMRVRARRLAARQEPAWVVANAERRARWRETARPEQLMPGTPGAASARRDWRTWLLMAGRGAGKSRAAAEELLDLCFSREWGTDKLRVALVSSKLETVRVDMVEQTILPALGGENGPLVLKWNRSTVELWLANGVYMKGYSSEKPGNLRGPNFGAAWADENANWIDADKAPSEDSTWSNLEFATRSEHGGTWIPRIIATTTPKPVRLLRVPDKDDQHWPGLADDDDTEVSHASTLANKAHLAKSFLKRVLKRYEGTRLGAQELDGQLLDGIEGALWSFQLCAAMRVPEEHWSRTGGENRTIVAVDPTVGDGKVTGDECGIVAMTLGVDGDVYVRDDATVKGSPGEWAKAVAACAARNGARVIVAEANQGGELVRSVIAAEAANIPVQLVHASDSKRARAEPVALLSEKLRVRFAGSFPLLEAQLCSWDPADKESPDRLDAFVWGVTHLIPPFAQTRAGAGGYEAGGWE